MGTLVMKFGGTTVGNVAALTQVLSIVMHEQKRWDRLIIVASALEGVTDALMEAAQLAQVNNQRGYRRITATLRARHLALVEQLPFGANERTSLEADIDRLLFEMLDICQSVASKTEIETLTSDITDSIVAVGERLAARIIAALLRKNDLRAVAIDGTDVIVTDGLFGGARPDVNATCSKVNEHLLPMLRRQIIPVVTGYIGATAAGRVTTLGRGGSDYTASLLAVCAQATEVWIWSNVDGMMSTDPDEAPNAHVIGELSYAEVAELAYFGARILHARMIHPLQAQQIPLRVKNVFKPQQNGTLIRDSSPTLLPRIKAVTSIQGIGLTAQRSGSLVEITRLVDDTLTRTIGGHADVMISAQSSSRSFLCFVLPPTAGGSDTIHSLVLTLSTVLREQDEHSPWTVRPVSVVTVIGESLDQAPDVSAQILLALRNTRILGISQGPSPCSMSFIVAQEDQESILQNIHSLILKQPAK
jgi:bifunctional aspartokinase / homoserine dehydrogenase 1